MVAGRSVKVIWTLHSCLNLLIDCCLSNIDENFVCFPERSQLRSWRLRCWMVKSCRDQKPLPKWTTCWRPGWVHIIHTRFACFGLQCCWTIVSGPWGRLPSVHHSAPYLHRWTPARRLARLAEESSRTPLEKTLSTCLQLPGWAWKSCFFDWAVLW